MTAEFCGWREFGLRLALVALIVLLTQIITACAPSGPAVEPTREHPTGARGPLMPTLKAKG
jgi:hypothetical protein